MTKNVFFEAGGGSSRLALVGSLIALCWPPSPPPNRWTGRRSSFSLPTGWHGAEWFRLSWVVVVVELHEPRAYCLPACHTSRGGTNKHPDSDT